MQSIILFRMPFQFNQISWVEGGEEKGKDCDQTCHVAHVVPFSLTFTYTYVLLAFENKLKVRFSIQATTALAETTAIADFRSLTVFSAIYVVYCTVLEFLYNT